LSGSLGLGALAFLGLYLLFMLGVGVLARKARENDSLADFYLAGGKLGSFVLFLTLYATQYSGNTLIGYPGEAYRMGFAWIMSVGFMMAILVAYLLFAPRLHRLAKRFAYVTPGDFLDHRFGSPSLSLTANLLFVFAVANYLLAQLMAMGHVVAGLSGGAVPYWMGVMLLTLIIAVYETLGGMRAVAWTDCVQGLMLLFGLLGILAAVAPSPDHLRSTTEWILAHQPEKAAAPSAEVCITWASTLLLVGFSGAVYPHAIQRIYAARNVAVLKRSLSLMVFMPLITISAVVLVGIFGIAHFAGLGKLEADQLMPMLMREWAGRSPWMYAMALLVFTGSIAAIMSTADSVLLSLSSILAKDFFGKSLLKNAPEAVLTRTGKWLSWGILAVLVSVALVPRITLWGLTELKMEILVQVTPAFVLGVTWRRLTGPAALAGMLAGTGLAAGLTLAGQGKLWGIHAGLVGFGLNLTLCGLISRLPALPPRKEAPARSAAG
jgi:SSS family solute:Na+ symporter